MLTSYSNNQLLYYHFQNYRPKTLMCLLIYCWFCVFLILEFACNVKSDACYLKIDACYVKSDACYVKWCACYVNNSLLPKYLYDILFEGVGMMLARWKIILAKLPSPSKRKGVGRCEGRINICPRSYPLHLFYKGWVQMYYFWPSPSYLPTPLVIGWRF